MGLFGKFKSSAPASQKQDDNWVPTSIEFRSDGDGGTHSHDTMSQVPSSDGSSGVWGGGAGEMVGRGMNSSQAGRGAGKSMPGGWRTSDGMEGRGVNSRRGPPQPQPQGRGGSPSGGQPGGAPPPNPFMDDSPGSNPSDSLAKEDDARKEAQAPNPFDLEYESDGASSTRSSRRGPLDYGSGGANPTPVDNSGKGNSSSKSNIDNMRDPQQKEGGLQQFEESLKAMEEKLSNIDSSKFMEFHDADSSATPLSGIDEESGDVSGSGGAGGGFVGGRNTANAAGGRGPAANAAGGRKGSGKKKKKGLKNFFKGRGSKGKKRAEPRAGSPRRIHRPAVDSDPEDDFSDGDEGYISGEYDEEFDNSEGFVPTDSRGPNSHSARLRKEARDAVGADAPIGVPNGRGAQMTSRQLEDELYLYKLETLNLTDACRDLAEQLEEVESKLESVQAQATFRIHALEAELQDGNNGLKSLVKMTSTEMDGRLEALRALGKTATVQAAKLKERDSELILVEQRLRKTRRDVKSLKRENKKVQDERTYLKSRLDELEQVKIGLEENLKQLATENASAAAALSAEEVEKVEKLKKKLNDTLEQVGYMKKELEGNNKELEELRKVGEEKEGEILEMKQELDRKEHDIVRVEQQLEKVRKDLLDAATTAEKAEEARVEAEGRESDVRKELEETLGCLEEVTTKVALLESTQTQLNQQLEDAEANAEKAKNAEEQRKRLTELEEEVDKLLEEKGWALDAVNDAQTAYANNIAERDAKIETLHKDVDVHREQMELAQTMLEEKETLASELRTQLEEATKEESMKIAQFEEDLAAKGREVSNITAELEERTKNVENLEERLEKVRKEFTEHRAEAEAAVAAAKAEASKESERSDKEAEESAAIAASNSAHAAQIAEQMAELAEKETQIERLERDLGTGKRQLEATRVELDEKDKHAERLKSELERIKTEKSAKVEELEGQLDEKNKSIESLRKDVETEKGTLNLVVDKMNKVQIDLEVALDATHEAEDARQRAVSEMEASKSDKEAAVRETESLKSQIETLQTANDAVVADVKALKSEADKERKSSAQAASTLAAKNAARQAELEMKIDKMQKDIDAKKREIDAIKSMLKEKDQTTDRLKAELQDTKEDFIQYKENIEKAKEKMEAEKEADALQRVADRDYFDESDVLSLSSSHGKEGSRGRGLLGGLFNRTMHDNDSIAGESVDWETKAKEKDARIAQLEKELADNSLSITNLKNELVTASSKFKDDESQRRLLIQRLENENQAYSIKLEVLETEFEEIRKRKEAVAVAKSNNSFLTDDGSVASSVHSNQSGSSQGTGFSASSCSRVSSTGLTSTSDSSMTGVSSVTGASRLTPLERDNKKLKKQKKVYETRIASLQTQLSEIQQIVPELMSKSKSQIQKLETVVETQRQEAQEREAKLEEEIAQLRQQNEQLQAATRSRLQSSDVDRQEEIDQLRMRLEAREATIKKLEMLASNGRSLRRKGGKILRKKKKKDPNNDGEVSLMSETSWGTEQQSVAGYSIADDELFSTSGGCKTIH